MVAPYLSEDEFDFAFEQFKSTVGGTNKDFFRVLQESFRYLPSVPKDMLEATGVVVQEAFDRFAASVHTSLVGQIDYPTFDIAIENLTVAAYNTTTYESTTAPVRLDGSFTFPSISPGEYDLIVTGGAVTATPHLIVTLTENEHVDINVPIVWGGGVTALVRSEFGQPLFDALVELHSPTRDLFYSTITDSAGKFSVADLYPGTYNVRITLGSHVEYVSTISISPGQTADEIYDLLPGATLAGTVIEQGSGILIADAEVWGRPCPLQLLPVLVPTRKWLKSTRPLLTVVSGFGSIGRPTSFVFLAGLSCGASSTQAYTLSIGLISTRT